jgi:YidC/Oxa1 family membrane protein insertase
MDRKAWIVVTLCALLMGLNAWYSAQLTAEQAKTAAAQAQAAAAQKKAEAAAAPTAAATPPQAATASPAAAATAPAPVKEETRELKNGSVTYLLTNQGGGIRKALLAGQDQIVLNNDGVEPIGAFRRDAKLKDELVYSIVESDAKHVVFEAKASDGLLVRKTYALTEGEESDEHLLKLTITLTNQGSVPHVSENHYLYAGAASSLKPNDVLHPSVFWNNYGDADQHYTTWFQGGWFSDEKAEFTQRFDQLRFGGVMSRFYANVIALRTKPSEEKPGKVWAERYKVDHSNDEHKDSTTVDWGIQGAVSLPPVSLAPGATQTLDYEVYLGPREYHRLKKIGHQRQQIMFYGWVKPVSLIFVHLMRWLHSAVGSWGWAIILMTITIRLATWPVFASSMKQAKRMGKLAPLMKDIQEKHKGDDQRISQEMMKLYKDYGFNPLGCALPMFLQILIFSGFYNVLQVAAELRGQPFWWAQDLSLPDTVAHPLGIALNPLPILMGLSTIIQMRLTPQAPTVDKSQQRMMMFMPLIFVFICYSFASALALYYTTQNIFGIFQSWAMRKMDKDDDTPLKKVEPAPTGLPPQSPYAHALGQPKHKEKKKKQTPKLGG